MAVSKAQQKAVNKYMAANYDRINLTVPKGKKDDIQAHAAALGESVNGFINRAIDCQMERDSVGAVAPAGDGVGVSPAVLKAAQEAAQAAGEGLDAFLDRAVATQAERDRRTKGLK